MNVPTLASNQAMGTPIPHRSAHHAGFHHAQQSQRGQQPETHASSAQDDDEYGENDNDGEVESEDDDDEDDDEEEEDDDEEEEEDDSSSSVDAEEEEPPIDWNAFDADAFVRMWLNPKKNIGADPGSTSEGRDLSSAPGDASQSWNNQHLLPAQPALSAQQPQQQSMQSMSSPLNFNHAPTSANAASPSFRPTASTPQYYHSHPQQLQHPSLPHHLPTPADTAATPAPNYDSAIEILTKVLGEGQEVPTEILAMILQSIAPSLGYQPPTPSQQPGIESLVPILRGLIEKTGGTGAQQQQANQFNMAQSTQWTVPPVAGPSQNAARLSATPDEEDDDEEDDPSYDPLSADLDINGALEEQMAQYLSATTPSNVTGGQVPPANNLAITPKQPADVGHKDKPTPRPSSHATNKGPKTTREERETPNSSKAPPDDATKRPRVGRLPIYDSDTDRRQARKESNRRAQQEWRARQRALKEEETTQQSGSQTRKGKATSARPSAATPKAPPSSMSALQEENLELRTQNKMLRQEVARLQRENVELRVDAGVVKRMLGGRASESRKRTRIRGPASGMSRRRYEDEEDEDEEDDDLDEHYSFEEDDDGYSDDSVSVHPPPRRRRRPRSVLS